MPENPCRGRIQPLRSLVHCGERRAGRGMLGPSIILQRGGHVDPQQHPGIFFYPPASHAGVAATKGMLELVSSGTPSSMGGEPLGAESAAAWGGTGAAITPGTLPLSPPGTCGTPRRGTAPRNRVPAGMAAGWPHPWRSQAALTVGGGGGGHRADTWGAGGCHGAPMPTGQPGGGGCPGWGLSWPWCPSPLGCIGGLLAGWGGSRLMASCEGQKWVTLHGIGG